MSDPSNEKQPGLLELLEQWEKQGASDAEITKRVRDYLSIKARIMGVPMRGTFELTPLCNLNCKMCYVHLSQNQLLHMGKGVLSTSQWKQIMSAAIDAGMTSAILTGGEALLHPGFDELYLFLHNHGIELNIKTNGLLLDESRIEFFKKHEPQCLQITLYGSDEDSYAKVTGHRCFSKVIQSVQRVMASNLPLRISITPSKYAQDNLEELIRYVHSLGVSYAINSTLYTPRDETGRSGEQNDLSIEEYVHLGRFVKEIEGVHPEQACTERLAPVQQIRQSPKGLRCGAGRDGFAVNWQGQMQPCLMLCHICEELQTTPFGVCWERIHREAENYPALEECQTCAYVRRCPYSCVAMHLPYGKSGHVDPELCNRAKRMVNVEQW